MAEQKQIPFGDDKKESKCNCKCKEQEKREQEQSKCGWLVLLS
jgi:hypothetical protein